jgi:hypothetical protein
MIPNPWNIYRSDVFWFASAILWLKPSIRIKKRNPSAVSPRANERKNAF